MLERFKHIQLISDDIKKSQEENLIHDVKNQRDSALQAYSECIALDNYTYTIELAKTYSETPFKN